MVVKFTAAGLVACIALADAAAQTRSYHHRSTVRGDHLAGLAELRLADGLAAYHTARAEAIVLENQRQRYQLAEQAREARIARELAREQRIARKRAARIATNRRREVEADAAAQELLYQVRQGVYRWPPALQEPLAAQSVISAETLLQDTYPVGNLDDDGRRSLADIVDYLLDLIRQRKIGSDHLQRRKATRAVRSLERLARGPLRAPFAGDSPLASRTIGLGGVSRTDAFRRSADGVRVKSLVK